MIDVILGLQWGDEGKGKIADYLTPKYDLVARFQGGPNAGHSLEFEGKKFVLNTIPSGIFRKTTLNLIGNGVVIDPVRLQEEIQRIVNECPDYKERLLISKKAHLILPTGPFPTELDNELGESLRQKGNEFGATTGRTRRTGWLDLVSLKYTCMLNGVDELIMMKGDVLNGFEELQAATHYKIGDTTTDEVPSNLCSTEVEPLYKSFKGWPTETTIDNGFDAMPDSFKDYIDFVQSYLGTKISVISMGPGRDETLVLN